MSTAAYNFPYWVCNRCAHTWASPVEAEAPRECEYCHEADLSGYTTLEDAEDNSQAIVEENRG